MPVMRIRGRISNLPQGTRGQSVRIMLFPAGRDAALVESGQPNSGVTRADGTFQISSVPAGSYQLVAMRMDRGAMVLGRMPVSVSSGDIDDVNLVLQGPVAITGSVRMPAGVEVKPDSIQINLEPLDRLMPGYARSALKPDGTFRIDSASRSQYAIRVSGAGEKLWVKSVKLGNQEVLSSGLDLESAGSLAVIEITMSDEVGTIGGAVKDGDQPAAGRMVTLIPEPFPLTLPQSLKTAQTGTGGTFSFQNVPPGNYRVYAWDEITYDLYSDPEFLKKHENDSIQVSVRAKATERAEPRVVLLAVKSAR
jgi:hypothetical protein